MNEPTTRSRAGRYLVRPMHVNDGPAVVAAFERLSDASRRARFFSPVPRIHAGMAADLVRVDDQRVVLLAFDESGTVVGEARAVRHRLDPATADIAVTVLDAYQHHGLGSCLLRRLGTEARRVGVTRFVGHVLVDNRAAQHLLARGGASLKLSEPGVHAFEIPLVPAAPQAGEATLSPLAVA